MSPSKVVHGQYGHEAHLVEHAQDEIPYFQVNGDAYEYATQVDSVSHWRLLSDLLFRWRCKAMERYFASIFESSKRVFFCLVQVVFVENVIKNIRPE